MTGQQSSGRSSGRGCPGPHSGLWPTCPAPSHSNCSWLLLDLGSRPLGRPGHLGTMFQSPALPPRRPRPPGSTWSVSSTQVDLCPHTLPHSSISNFSIGAAEVSILPQHLWGWWWMWAPECGFAALICGDESHLSHLQRHREASAATCEDRLGASTESSSQEELLPPITPRGTSWPALGSRLTGAGLRKG